MNIKCRNLFDLKSFESIEMIAGKNGLDNIITWVYINQDLSLKNWIHGGELVFITGMEATYKNDSFFNIVTECIENAVSGIVILCNDEYIGEIPSQIIDLCNKNNMPLFKMPWNIKLVDVTKEIANTIIMSQFKERISSKFFLELLFSEVFSITSVKNSALHCGVSAEENSQIMILKTAINGEFDANKLETINSFLQKRIDDYFYFKKIDAVSYILMDEILIFANSNSNVIYESLQRDLENFATKFPRLKIFVGISEKCSDISMIRSYYSQAQQALYFSEKTGHDISTTLFENLGILRLFLNQKDTIAIQKYCYDNLSAVIDFDNKKSTEYLKTLKVYLINNCNLVKSSEELFIHRNTMVYRVDKLKELLKTDFEDMYLKAELVNALKLFDFYMFDAKKMTNSIPCL